MMPMKCLRPRLLSVLTFVFFSILAALCVVNLYTTTKLQGLDATLNYGAENDIFAITIAISENRYDFHEGYVGIPEVEAALQAILMPKDDPSKWQALAGNRQAIESAFQAASHLDPSTFTPYKTTRAPFVIMPGEDTGLADFYRLSFSLFGYHADAMFKCFMLLFSLSTVLFLWQSRNQPWAMGLLVILLFSFNMLFYSDAFVGRVDAPSIMSSRNLGLLTLVATLHLMLFSHMRGRYCSISSWVVWVMQLALLLFMMSVRSSTHWQWLLLLVWLAAPLAWQCWRHGVRATWRVYFPAFVTLFAVLGFQLIVANERMLRHDEVYSSECAMTHHLRWHSAYLAFNLHPKWAEYAPPEAGGVLRGDRLAWNVAEAYWNRSHPEASYVCPYFYKFYRMGVHDQLMRQAFMDFISLHPRMVLELYAWYKPEAIFNKLKSRVVALPGWWGYAVAGFAAISFLMALAASQCQRRIAPVLAVSAATLLSLFMFSTMPHMFAYPVYMMETITLLFACMALAACIAAALAGALAGRMLRRLKRQS